MPDDPRDVYYIRQRGISAGILESCGGTATKLTAPFARRLEADLAGGLSPLQALKAAVRSFVPRAGPEERALLQVYVVMIIRVADEGFCEAVAAELGHTPAELDVKTDGEDLHRAVERVRFNRREWAPRSVPRRAASASRASKGGPRARRRPRRGSSRGGSA